MSKLERLAVIPKNDTRRGIATGSEAAVSLLALANGDRALRSILEHDFHYMPIGKLADATVDETEHEFILRAVVDDTQQVRHFRHDGTDTQLVEVTFINDSRPFVHQPLSDRPETVEVLVEPANFQNPTGFSAFVDEAKHPPEFADNAGLMQLRSSDPTPIIQFLVDHPVLASALGWVLWRGQKFLAYTVDETLKKAGDRISADISRRIRNVIDKYNQHRADDDREPTSHLVLKGDVEINLLTRCTDIEQQTDLGLSSLCEQMERFKDLVELAESITLARNHQTEDWELLYIETSDGNVIATAECYESTVEAYQTLRWSLPVCLCLVHKMNGGERHYKTLARFDKLDEHGSYRMTITRYPEDIDDWQIVNVALEIGENPDLTSSHD